MSEPKSRFQKIMKHVYGIKGLSHSAKSVALAMVLVCRERRVRIGPGLIAGIAGMSYGATRKMMLAMTRDGYFGSDGSGGGRGRRAVRWIQPKLVAPEVLESWFSGQKNRYKSEQKQVQIETKTGTNLDKTGTISAKKQGRAVPTDSKSQTGSGQSDRTPIGIDADANRPGSSWPDIYKKRQFTCYEQHEKKVMKYIGEQSDWRPFVTRAEKSLAAAWAVERGFGFYSDLPDSSSPGQAETGQG